MKVVLHYSTKTIALITTCYGTVYECNLRCQPLSDLVDWAQAIFEDMTEFRAELVAGINFIDAETGELLLECTREAGPTAVEDWDYNEDMGFDPYLGCYTDDC